MPESEGLDKQPFLSRRQRQKMRVEVMAHRTPQRHGISRRNLGKSALAAAGAAAAAVAGVEILHKQSEDERVVQEYLKQLEIAKDAEEITLWNQQYQRSEKEQYVTFGSPAHIEAGHRVNNILDAMALSKNKYFSDAANLFNQYYEAGRVDDFELSPSIDREGFRPTSTFSGRIVNGKLVFFISLGADYIINRSSGVGLAVTLVHEIDHIRSMIEFVDSLGNGIDDREKLKKVEALKNDQAIWLKEEARAESVEALAYMTQYGLTGRRFEPREKDAAAFVRAGANPESQGWLDHIRKQRKKTGAIR